jgi:hypothetical protein
MLIYIAESNLPLEEQECIISASQEAIFEHLLGASLTESLRFPPL